MTTNELAALVPALGRLTRDIDDAERIDQIRLLEQLKSAAAAAQASVTASFVASQRASQAAAGMPAERIGRGIAAQVALAKRCSPHEAQRYVGWSVILIGELPATFAALRAGDTSEWRAMVVARETAWLSREDRRRVDQEIAPRIAELGNRKVEAETKKLAYRLDPHGYVDRMRAAPSDRRVWLRPAPDAMCRLTALLPVAEGVATYAALGAGADAAVGIGDLRGRGQIMADTLVERVTGQRHAGDVPVEVHLVMTDQALLDAGPEGNEPATILGYGPVPAAIARDLVTRAGEGVPRWLRRLYREPGTGQLARMDSRRRLFTPAQRKFVALRDHSCRTPWCDADLRHVDHVKPHVAGGPTAVVNGKGLCVACNHAKQAPGWHEEVTDEAGKIVTTTPTGHRYGSRPPDPPGTANPNRPPAAA